jgi:fucose permease
LVSPALATELTPVSILFFLWGFAKGLIGALSMDIQKLLGYSPPHSIALHNAYWAAYFFGPLLVGYWVLKYHGFKATFITGLAIYAAGAMAFWPSSVLRSYAGFFISNFIVGFGLSCVEVAANLFIALAGPGELSEARLNFARGIAAIGMVISSVLVQKALFPGIHQEDLFRIQWYYLGLALFIILLAVVFYYVPLSEEGDDDLEAIALQRLYNAGLDKDVKAFRVEARHLLLWSGVCVMLIPSGAHEVVSYFWTPLVQDAKPGRDPLGTMAISNTAFAFGRFLAAGLCYFGIPPRVSVGIFAFGAFLIALLAMVLPRGPAALTMLILITFFESPLFPTMFGITLRGQGKHTKFAAAALIMGEAWGAIWPSIAYAVDQGNSLSFLIVPAVLWGVSMLWSVMLSSTRVMRRWVDPKWSRPRVATVEHRHGAAVAPRSAGFRHEIPSTANFDTVPERPTAATSPPDSSERPRKPTVSTAT